MQTIVCLMYLRMEKIYDIGLIFADGMAQKLGLDERAYLEKFYQYLVNNMKQPLINVGWKEGFRYQQYFKVLWKYL